MKLFVKDRIYIPQLLPQQNNFMEFNLKRSILKKIALTEEDKDKYEIKTDADNQRVTWNIEKDQGNPIEVQFTDEESKYLKDGCEKLSEQQYPDDFWGVVEKIYNE